MPDVLRGTAPLELDAVVRVELPAGVHAPHHVRQPLSHVAEEQLGAREVVEDAAEDQAQGVGGGVDAPAPHRSDEFGVPGQHVRGVDAVGRVQVERYVEVFGALPDDAQGGVVQVPAVGVRVDEGAAQAELRDRALQLVGRGPGVLQRQRGEAGETVGVLGDDAGEEVVDRGRLAYGGGRVLLRLEAGELSDRTCMSRPAASMASRRSSVRSRRRREASAQAAGWAMDAVDAPWPTRSGVTKCSSRPISFIAEFSSGGSCAFAVDVPHAGVRRCPARCEWPEGERCAGVCAEG